MSAAAAVTAGIVAISAVAVIVIVVAPWRRVRAEKPLDPTIETRLLLNEDPRAVAAAADRLEERPTPEISLDRPEAS